MDPIQPPPEIITPQPKPNYLKTIFFSILGVLLVSSIIYLYLQNQSLQKQIVDLQISPTVQVPSSTPKPSSSISIPPDETAGWKTYVNTSANYSIKYPSGWKVENYGLMDPKPADSTTKNIRLFYQPDVSKVAKELNIEEVPIIPTNIEVKLNEIKIIGAQSSKCWTTGDSISTFCYIKVSNINKYLSFVITNYNILEDKKTLDQILSTFKFTAAN